MTYSWNRACYGISDTGKPHLRIESRYIASSPTVIDEMANTTFWTGLMMGMPGKYANLKDEMSFIKARQGFHKAAQYGIDSNFKWFDEMISAQDLILKIIGKRCNGNQLDDSHAKYSNLRGYWLND